VRWDDGSGTIIHAGADLGPRDAGDRSGCRDDVTADTDCDADTARALRRPEEVLSRGRASAHARPRGHSPTRSACRRILRDRSLEHLQNIAALPGI
jgi:hypothetical protein